MPCELSEAGTCGGWGPLHLPDLVCSLGPDVGMGFVPEPSSGGSSHSKKEQRRGRLCPTLSCPGQPRLRLQLSPLKTTCFSDQTQPGRVPSTQKMLLATAGRQSHHRGARASPCPLSLPWLWASYCRNEATWLLHLSIILIPDEHGKMLFKIPSLWLCSVCKTALRPLLGGTVHTAPVCTTGPAASQGRISMGDSGLEMGLVSPRAV